MPSSRLHLLSLESLVIIDYCCSFFLPSSFKTANRGEAKTFLIMTGREKKGGQGKREGERRRIIRKDKRCSI
jgi:hypothetical protein